MSEFKTIDADSAAAEAISASTPTPKGRQGAVGRSDEEKAAVCLSQVCIFSQHQSF